MQFPTCSILTLKSKGDFYNALYSLMVAGEITNYDDKSNDEKWFGIWWN